MLARLMMVAGVFSAALLPSGASRRRVALVIGNSAYKHATTLRNPGNDANDVAEILKKLGFDVLLGLDLDQQELRPHHRAVRAHAGRCGCRAVLLCRATACR